MFRGTVLSNGQVVGTWKKGGTPKNRRIDAEPFTEFTTGVASALERKFSALPF